MIQIVENITQGNKEKLVDAKDLHKSLNIKKPFKKWKAYYKQFETDNFGMKWIADEHVEKHFNRWNSLQNITKCYYEEVSFR